MQTVQAGLVRGKKVILRLDLDVPIEKGQIKDDFRLKAAMDTLKLCLENADKTTVCGHIGRPGGLSVEALSVAPVAKWIRNYCLSRHFPSGKLDILENLRFEEGEEGVYAEYAMELAKHGDFFVNEAFASHHEAASTTLLPKLLPHAAGLRFAKEVEVLTKIRQSPQKPFVAIIGGIKLDDKYPAIVELSKIADAVLVGGLLPLKIKEENKEVAANVMLGKLDQDGADLAPETIDSFAKMLAHAKQIVWAGPLGKYEDPKANKGNLALAQAVIKSGANSIIGGGDTIAALDFYLDKFSFVSVGGGAMLKFLTDGTLVTIKALN